MLRKRRRSSKAEIDRSVFHNIPDSIILEIFKLLNYEELCKVSGVCRRWYTISHDVSLQKVVDVSTRMLNIKQVKNLLYHRLTLSIQELHIRGFYSKQNFRRSTWKTPTLSKYLLSLLTLKCPTLQSLYLWQISIERKSNTESITVHDFPPSLVLLSLRDSYFCPDMMLAPRQNGKVPSLSILDLSGCGLVSSPDLIYLKSWASLKALSLEGCFRINSGGLENMLPMLKSLTILDLEGTDINNAGVELLLRTCKELKSLFLGTAPITGTSFYSCSRGSVQKLHTLCLKNIRFSEDVFIHVSIIAPNLKLLIAAKECFTDEFEVSLRQSWTNCRIALEKMDQGLKSCRHFANVKTLSVLRNDL